MLHQGDKINTCSSTEAELVGLNDVLLQIFLKAQGYQSESTTLYGHNMSTILLAKMAECQAVNLHGSEILLH